MNINCAEDMNQNCSEELLNLTSLSQSVSYGGKRLSRVHRHPSQLSVPEVPTTVPPQLQPLD